jgi:hypothetical protein
MLPVEDLRGSGVVQLLAAFAIKFGCFSDFANLSLKFQNQK